MKDSNVIFERGDVIVFCDEFLSVEENYGETGAVCYLDGSPCSTRFRWTFEGETCRLASVDELLALKPKGLPLVAEGLAKRQTQLSQPV